MDHPPLKGSQLLFGTLSLSLVNFMVILDMTIANVAVPHIAGNLAASPNQGTWVVTSYAVAEAITVPLTGWLAQRFTQVRLIIACILLFTLASIFCGLSTSLSMLVFARVLQGLAGGPIMAMTQTLLLASFPRAKAGTAMGLFAMTTLLAPVFGPIVGGAIVDNLSWHWIFFINVPVGIICAGLVWSLYHKRNTDAHKLPIDYTGLVLLVLFVGALQVILDTGREHDWFGSPMIITLAVVSALAFVLLIGWELTDDHPVVDLRLFKSRNVTAGIFGLAAMFAVMFGGLVLLPLWLQTQMGYTAIWAGYAIAPMGAGAVLAAPLAGKLSTKVDPRVMVTAGVAFIMSAFFLRSQFTADADFLTIAAPQLLQGFGMPLIFMPCVLLATAAVPGPKVASVAGLQNFIRTTAGAFGAAITNTYWDNQITQHRVDLVGQVATGAPQFEHWRETLSTQGFSAEQSLQLVDRTVQGQAVMLATNQYFALATVVLLSVVAIIWTARPVPLSKEAGAAAAAAH
jgi:MFS transporter, DHA2 family, multidrug resistance protein